MFIVSDKNFDEVNKELSRNLDIALVVPCPYCKSDHTKETDKYKVETITDRILYIHKCNSCDSRFVVKHQKWWIPMEISPIPNDISDFYKSPRRTNNE